LRHWRAIRKPEDFRIGKRFESAIAVIVVRLQAIFRRARPALDDSSKNSVNLKMMIFRRQSLLALAQ
jgi:hypothetical protein